MKNFSVTVGLSRAFTLLAGLLFASTVFAQSYTEGRDLPNAGDGTQFKINGAGVFTYSGTVTTPDDGQDRFQILLAANLKVSAVSFSASGGNPSGGQMSFNTGYNDGVTFGYSDAKPEHQR